jgi:CubicO group peptidase (beta-lactamase class C family)
VTESSGAPLIEGFVAPGWEPVREVFEENFTARGELGAGVAVLADGEQVVGLQGGWADEARTRPWQPDTLVHVWSTTKAMTALCVHILMDRGVLDPDAPVSRYWPEFAAGGKAGIPLRWVLSHRAGLSGLSVPVRAADLLDWERMTSLLAAQEPLWEPGTVSGYHAITFGYLAGEVVRRVTGQSLGQFFAAEVAGPLDADFHIGLGPDDLPRCADLVSTPLSERQLDRMAQAFNNGHPAARALLLERPLGAGDVNDPGWRMAEIPAANGHGTALALATVAGSLAGGAPVTQARAPRSPRLIGVDTLDAARTSQGRGQDLVLRVPMEWGLGVALSGPEQRFGPNPAAFGHDGAGGSAVSVDPEAGIGFAYVMNRMGASLVDDPRKMALLGAVYTSLGGVR